MLTNAYYYYYCMKTSVLNFTFLIVFVVKADINLQQRTDTFQSPNLLTFQNQEVVRGRSAPIVIHSVRYLPVWFYHITCCSVPPVLPQLAGSVGNVWLIYC